MMNFSKFSEKKSIINFNEKSLAFQVFECYEITWKRASYMSVHEIYVHIVFYNEIRNQECVF